jgi:hypothetical protein
MGGRKEAARWVSSGDYGSAALQILLFSQLYGPNMKMYDGVWETRVSRFPIDLYSGQEETALPCAIGGSRMSEPSSGALFALGSGFLAMYFVRDKLLRITVFVYQRYANGRDVLLGVLSHSIKKSIFPSLAEGP